MVQVNLLAVVGYGFVHFFKEGFGACFVPALRQRRCLVVIVQEMIHYPLLEFLELFRKRTASYGNHPVFYRDIDFLAVWDQADRVALRHGDDGDSVLGIPFAGQGECTILNSGGIQTFSRVIYQIYTVWLRTDRTCNGACPVGGTCNDSYQEGCGQ